jgi:hypothetical protein
VPIKVSKCGGVLLPFFAKKEAGDINSIELTNQFFN